MVILDKPAAERTERATAFVNAVALQQQDLAASRTAAVGQRLERVLAALAEERVGTQHFASLTGYGHGDQGREVVDHVFARVLGAESAAVRMQFVSGTHAIAAALFGVLRPGDRLLSITGRPYDTLEEVIGLRESGQGSLAEFGVAYDEVDLLPTGVVDDAAMDLALEQPCRMVLIQRSCGYSWRPSIDVAEIGRLAARIHARQPDCVVFVDNCYGTRTRFVRTRFVTALVRNPRILHSNTWTPNTENANRSTVIIKRYVLNSKG